LFYIK